MSTRRKFAGPTLPVWRALGRLDGARPPAPPKPPTTVVWLAMPRGNPSPKLAITVDAEVHSRIVAAASEEGTSVSAWMTNAARRALLVGDGLRAVAEWEAEQGALTDAEIAAARRRVADERSGPAGPAPA